ncbi:hypothetical protein THTE_1786 [Thermogutta terrifontis]|uniref:Uncharacterized protein n=1 Tax=Thermogutta terrifontis TaxID=1331910 RepID=A0A286REK2_9BACT|nr:hypothetical protein THTE_1786 [Thermogutta terrifontis]
MSLAGGPGGILICGSCRCLGANEGAKPCPRRVFANKGRRSRQGLEVEDIQSGGTLLSRV